MLGKLFDLEELVLVYTREALTRVGGGPPNFQAHNLRRFPETDVLLDGIGAEGAATADSAVNRAGAVSFIFHGHLDARADSRAVRFDAHQFDGDRIIGAPGIRKHAELMGVAGSRPTD